MWLCGMKGPIAGGRSLLQKSEKICIELIWIRPTIPKTKNGNFRQAASFPANQRSCQAKAPSWLQFLLRAIEVNRPYLK